MKKKPVRKVGARRYDEATIKSIVAFLKGHTNLEVKAKFKCSSHFAGDLRRKFKIDLPERSKIIPSKGKKTTKPAKGKTKKRKVVSDLL